MTSQGLESVSQRSSNTPPHVGDAKNLGPTSFTILLYTAASISCGLTTPQRFRVVIERATVHGAGDHHIR
jgi:hypothetical protein